MSGTLSSHILDTHLGKPAADIAVTLHRVSTSGEASLLANGITNADGRVTPDSWSFNPTIDIAEYHLDVGRYTLTFDTQAYFDTQNLTAFEKIIRTMKEAGIGYGSINHPVDRDPVCGFTGIIGNTCPSCGREEGDVKFERIRRITGYLVGTVERFNDAKRAEEHDRIKHMSFSK